MVFQKGKIPLNTFEYNIKYHFNEFKTPSGICSIKLWVFFNSQNNLINSKFTKKIRIKNNI